MHCGATTLSLSLFFMHVSHCESLNWSIQLHAVNSMVFYTIMCQTVTCYLLHLCVCVNDRVFGLQREFGLSSLECASESLLGQSTVECSERREVIHTTHTLSQ